VVAQLPTGVVVMLAQSPTGDLLPTLVIMYLFLAHLMMYFLME
jgi:hypothetical protein